MSQLENKIKNAIALVAFPFAVWPKSFNFKMKFVSMLSSGVAASAQGRAEGVAGWGGNKIIKACTKVQRELPKNW